MAMVSLLDLLRRIDAGEMNSSEAIQRALSEIKQKDDLIKAFVSVDHGARAQTSGPLRGITFGVKDIIDTADLPTEMGSSIYAGWRPKADAFVVAALKAAGATLLGKTSTTAFDTWTRHQPEIRAIRITRLADLRLDLLRPSRLEWFHLRSERNPAVLLFDLLLFAVWPLSSQHSN